MKKKKLSLSEISILGGYLYAFFVALPLYLSTYNYIWQYESLKNFSGQLYYLRLQMCSYIVFVQVFVVFPLSLLGALIYKDFKDTEVNYNVIAAYLVLITLSVYYIYWLY